jgi:hypothetical protein
MACLIYDFVLLGMEAFHIRICFIIPGTFHVAPGTSHVAPGTSHVAPGTSHVAPGTSHVAPGTSHVPLHLLFRFATLFTKAI